MQNSFEEWQGKENILAFVKEKNMSSLSVFSLSKQKNSQAVENLKTIDDLVYFCVPFIRYKMLMLLLGVKVRNIFFMY